MIRTKMMLCSGPMAVSSSGTTTKIIHPITHLLTSYVGPGGSSTVGMLMELGINFIFLLPVRSFEPILTSSSIRKDPAPL